MGIGPIAAIPKALAEVGLTKDQVDIWEVYIGCIVDWSLNSTLK